MTILAFSEDVLETMADAVVEVDIDGSGTWEAIQDQSNKVEPNRGDVGHTRTKTLDGETYLTTELAGNEATVDVTSLFTQGTNNLFLQVYARRGLPFGVRWSKSGTAGDTRFTASGRLKACTPVGFDSSSSDAAIFKFTVVAGDIEAETISA